MADQQKHQASDGRRPKILVVNPNSSKSVTDNLERTLPRPAGVTLDFYTAPSPAPPSINDAPTSILSASVSFADLTTRGAGEAYDGILVCCFSAHPLVGMLRHAHPSLDCLHILEAAVSGALSSSSGGFGVITTGQDMVTDIDNGVLNFLGGVSARYKGCLATGLGVLELQDSSRRDVVEAKIGETALALVASGAESLILGCAAMSGMESMIRGKLAEKIGKARASRIALIDGARYGPQLLAALIANRA